MSAEREADCRVKHGNDGYVGDTASAYSSAAARQ